MGIIMKAFINVEVALAMLMAAIVDAKIYERCELALKLEREGLNGFKGYTVGDCETPAALSPTHTPSCPPYSDPVPPLVIYHFPRPGHDPLGHPLTDCDG